MLACSVISWLLRHELAVQLERWAPRNLDMPKALILSLPKTGSISLSGVNHCLFSGSCIRELHHNDRFRGKLWWVFNQVLRIPWRPTQLYTTYRPILSDAKISLTVRNIIVGRKYDRAALGIRIRMFLGLQDPDPDPSLFWNNAWKNGNFNTKNLQKIKFFEVKYACG